MTGRLRQAARQAIAAHDELLEAWREWSREGKPPPTSDDLALLEELVYRKIYPINAFELLTRLDIEAAITSLLGRYLGLHISPDRGFGGFQFEMSSMLDDLVLVGGERAMLRLIHHPGFNQDMLLDPRFRASACASLQFDDAAFTSWLANHPKPDTSD